MKSEETCGFCGCEETSKYTVKSIRHSHPASSQIQKEIQVTMFFRRVDNNEPVWLCEKHQNEVINGASYGGMVD